jgi:hypothetical protein
MIVQDQYLRVRIESGNTFVYFSVAGNVYISVGVIFLDAS